jgi:ACT domain-containing protein
VPIDDETLRRLVAEVTREVARRDGAPSSVLPASPASAEPRPRSQSRAVVTTTGKNQRGIVAHIAQAIADAGGDIVDIAQTLVSDYFTMIIIVDTSALAVPFAEFKRRVEQAVAAHGAQCLVMHEAVVNALQRI